MDKHVKGPIQLYRESVANIKIVDFNGGYNITRKGLLYSGLFFVFYHFHKKNCKTIARIKNFCYICRKYSLRKNERGETGRQRIYSS